MAATVRGWKTSEFYVTALVIAGIVLTSVSSVDVLPTKWAKITAAATAAAYAISRGLAKKS